MLLGAAKSIDPSNNAVMIMMEKSHLVDNRQNNNQEVSYLASESSARVSTFELFFDLVFVFTITQVTQLVIKVYSFTDWYEIFLVLAITWWMYSGYVWLTNNVDIRRPTLRILLLSGMAGFLVMALAIPRTFHNDGILFALGYLLVTLVHAGLFTHAENASARAVWRIAPYNLTGAGLILAAGFISEPWNWLLWTAALAVLIASTLLRRERGFVISPSHFVERHGLVVLIVLGESLVAIGTGAADEPLGPLLILAALLGLMLSTALWWSYFSQDDTRAEHALDAVTGVQRTRMAVSAYGYAHLIIIAGIVVLAAGLKQVIAHLHEPPYAPGAWNLGIGVGLYLLGDVLFRSIVSIGYSKTRLIAGVLAFLTIPIGLALGGLAQVGLLVLMLIGAYVNRNAGARGISQRTARVLHTSKLVTSNPTPHLS
jgi:low temperature requirement protein LtrA